MADKEIAFQDILEALVEQKEAERKLIADGYRLYSTQGGFVWSKPEEFLSG